MAAVELCAASAANIVIHVQSIHEKVVLDTSGGGLQQFWLQPRVQLAVSSPPGLPSVPPSATPPVLLPTTLPGIRRHSAENLPQN